jgi:hypothetical protein
LIESNPAETQLVFSIGPIQITGTKELFNSDTFSNLQKKIDYDLTYKIVFKVNRSCLLPSSIKWFCKKTHHWGIGEDFYYLRCGEQHKPIYESTDSTLFWCCKIKKDFSECIVTPPLSRSNNFLHTLIFNRVFSGFITFQEIMIFCHCCSAIINNVGIIFLGDSGAGKTTLATIIQQGGGHILSDDQALLFQKDDKLLMTGIPRGNGDYPYFSDIVVPVNKIFLLDKHSPIGEYDINLKERYMSISKSFFGTTIIPLYQPDPLTQFSKQIVKHFGLFKDLEMKRLGFEKSYKTWRYLCEIIS